jgi:hypothetical protein
LWELGRRELVILALTARRLLTPKVLNKLECHLKELAILDIVLARRISNRLILEGSFEQLRYFAKIQV